MPAAPIVRVDHHLSPAGNRFERRDGDLPERIGGVVHPSLGQRRVGCAHSCIYLYAVTPDRDGNTFATIPDALKALA